MIPEFKRSSVVSQRKTLTAFNKIFMQSSALAERTKEGFVSAISWNGERIAWVGGLTHLARSKSPTIKLNSSFVSRLASVSFSVDTKVKLSKRHLAAL
ncbi:hypothetical protein AVEN_178829-1 [Araneus ventricosus]|uniref:Uncharacterized protein n=1 Tax=Araneus ventricosus TaxID=182803 RepID=A0A4Y2BGY3_ARAVE|nr:hypothetical protein AVEN_178829-1 [Araneus ventricosus]